MVIQKSAWRSAALFVVFCGVLPFVAVLAIVANRSSGAIPGNHCKGLVTEEVGCTQTGRSVICDPCWSPGFPCQTGRFMWRSGSCTISYQIVGGFCGPCDPQW